MVLATVLAELIVLPLWMLSSFSTDMASLTDGTLSGCLASCMASRVLLLYRHVRVVQVPKPGAVLRRVWVQVHLSCQFYETRVKCGGVAASLEIGEVPPDVLEGEGVCEDLHHFGLHSGPIKRLFAGRELGHSVLVTQRGLEPVEDI